MGERELGPEGQEIQTLYFGSGDGWQHQAAQYVYSSTTFSLPRPKITWLVLQ